MDANDEKPSAAEHQLLAALGELAESISFCVSDTRPLVLPGLTVDGVGEIALPVSRTDARRLIKHSSQAPYGQGEATIVDTDVRRVWQLEPDQFRLENPTWQSLVRDITNSVKSEFGIQEKVTASLYKLLIYEKGSFFAPHRDTEKAHRMFATLVICLPSKHEGGQLIVSHAGQSQVVDFSGRTSNYELRYATFYADCQHEVRPVTDGYRVCLVYNLATSGSKKQPAAPEFRDAIESATKAVEAIFEEDDQRDMIVVPLLHQYTEAGLAPDVLENSASDDETWEEGERDNDGWEEDRDEELDEEDRVDEEEGASADDSWDDETSVPGRLRQIVEKSPKSDVAPAPLEFKGSDRARAGVLGQVAARANCRSFVALLTHWQSGYPDDGTIEYSPYGGRWGHRNEDVSAGNERAEFEEIFDESISLKHWRSLDGQRQSFDELTIEESDIVTDECEDDWPYRQELHEATGNEGMSMERWYHRAVVVLWPEARHFHVLASQGTRNSVPALHELVTTTEEPARCKDCRSFARSIIGHWQYAMDHRRGQTDSLGTIMMRSLLAIGDAKLAVKFFEQVLPLEYAALDTVLLVDLAELARWKSIEKPLISFFRNQKPDDYRADLPGLISTFGSLASLGVGVSSVRKQVCKSALNEVTEMLARWEKSRSTSMGRHDSFSRSNDFVGVVEPLVRGICSVGVQRDLKQLLARIAAKPKHYDLHGVVIPAAKNLSGDQYFVASSKLAELAVRELRQFCIDELTQRTARQPEPPRDWKRSAKLSCDCEDCRELGRFLKDKSAQVHRFPRRTDLRQHLHRQIDHHRIDCAHVTERRGRPYTLVCTKNQASFERDLIQYTTDCKLLQELSDG
jgi:predicted 2-oxoglutarate/Fe(II)-dependent dioxygenase YbiX